MFLLDTCILVSAFVPDTYTQRSLAWLDANRASPIAINDWTSVEFASALMLKNRIGQLHASGHRTVMQAYRARSSGFHLIELTREHFSLAEGLCESTSLGLRAGDALHAAVALTYTATLLTTDKALLSVSGAIGLRCCAP
jgi:predicted nucleic acid-binding protein